MLKRFTKVLTVWGGIDATICAGLLIYDAVKAIQQDMNHRKYAKES